MTQAYFYDSEGRDRAVDFADLEQHAAALGERQLLWIDAVRGDGVPACSVTALGIADDLLHAALGPGAPPALATQGGQFGFGLPLPPDDQGAGGRLDFIVGTGWLVTVRDGEVPFLQGFREQDQGESFTGGLTPAALCASLVDRQLETFQDRIAAIHKGADRIDAEILGARHARPPLAELSAMRRRVGTLRDALDLHRGVIQGLLRPDFEPLGAAGDRAHFAALERHFERAEDWLDRARETVLASFDLYATRTAQETNELVNVLTIVTVMLGVSGLIAALFSLSIDTPLEHSGWQGFAAVTAAMLASALLVLLIARWRRWL